MEADSERQEGVPSGSAWRQRRSRGRRSRACVNVRVVADSEHQEKVRIDVPLLLIWGERDHALGTELIAPSMQLTTRGRVERFPDATHWVNHEKVVEVTRLLLEQFTGQADVH